MSMSPPAWTLLPTSTTSPDHFLQPVGKNTSHLIWRKGIKMKNYEVWLKWDPVLNWGQLFQLQQLVTESFPTGTVAQLSPCCGGPTRWTSLYLQNFADRNKGPSAPVSEHSCSRTALL